MSIRWERLDGDTALFAIKVAFHSDPDDGTGADTETSASWGAIELWVDGKNLCAHEDQGETLQGVHWYLLPFFEWVVANWDPLLHEERLPRLSNADDAASGMETWLPLGQLADDENVFAHVTDRYDWQLRHGLRAARDGGVFPGLYLRRLRDRVEVSWKNTRIPGAAEVDFLTGHGHVHLEPSRVAEPLFAVTSEAVTWLRHQLPESARLADLQASAERLRSADRTDQRVSWLAGLRTKAGDVARSWQYLRDRFVTWPDPDAFRQTFIPTPSRSNLIVEGSCEAALLFGTTNPELGDDDAELLARLLLEQYRSVAPTLGLDRHARREPVDPFLSPWRQGYELALDLHEELEVERDGWVDVHAVFADLGIETREVVMDDQSIRAASFASPQHIPTTAVNQNSHYWGSSGADRFTLAHELCHLLFDREYGVRVAVASGPWAPASLEKRANAFAAMFLMPPDLLTRVAGWSDHPLYSPDGLREVAKALKVSPSALQEHARNIGLLVDVPQDLM